MKGKTPTRNLLSLHVPLELINVCLISSWKRYLDEPDRGGSSAVNASMSGRAAALACSQSKQGAGPGFVGSLNWDNSGSTAFLFAVLLYKRFF